MRRILTGLPQSLKSYDVLDIPAATTRCAGPRHLDRLLYVDMRSPSQTTICRGDAHIRRPELNAFHFSTAQWPELSGAFGSSQGEGLRQAIPLQTRIPPSCQRRSSEEETSSGIPVAVWMKPTPDARADARYSAVRRAFGRNYFAGRSSSCSETRPRRRHLIRRYVMDLSVAGTVAQAGRGRAGASKGMKVATIRERPTGSASASMESLLEASRRNHVLTWGGRRRN